MFLMTCYASCRKTAASSWWTFCSGFIVPERTAIGGRMVADRIARRSKDSKESDEGGAIPSFDRRPNSSSFRPAASTR